MAMNSLLCGCGHSFWGLALLLCIRLKDCLIATKVGSRSLTWAGKDKVCLSHFDCTFVTIWCRLWQLTSHPFQQMTFTGGLHLTSSGDWRIKGLETAYPQSSLVNKHVIEVHLCNADWLDPWLIFLEYEDLSLHLMGRWLWAWPFK